jgi:hypothetical protein
MPVKISIEADNLEVIQALLTGMTGAMAAELAMPVLSDQAPSDIIQAAGGIEAWVDEDPDPLPAVDQAELPLAVPQPQPKKLGTRARKSKSAPVLIEDIEPSPEVLTEEDEAEAEGAVDVPEPPVAVAGVTEADLRKRVKAIMDTEGPAAATARLKVAGYRAVGEVPPEQYGRVLALLDAKA